MRKICLTVVGFYLMILHAFSQVTTKDSSTYQPKKLKVEEVNLISSYYTQSGDHSAIRGGIGSEKVTDLANGLEVKWVGWDSHQRKNTLTAGLGIDYHTAASQAWVSKKGASKRHNGRRLYPSLAWTRENEKKGTSFSLGAYYSNEFNYQSLGVTSCFTNKTNTTLDSTPNLSVLFYQIKLTFP